MTPKEKAEDLLYQMRCDHMDGILTKKKARRCAKIAVDEILEATKKIRKWGGGDPEGVMVNFEEVEYDSYWEEVKQEIEKI